MKFTSVWDQKSQKDTLSSKKKRIGKAKVRKAVVYRATPFQAWLKHGTFLSIFKLLYCGYVRSPGVPLVSQIAIFVKLLQNKLLRDVNASKPWQITWNPPAIILHSILLWNGSIVICYKGPCSTFHNLLGNRAIPHPDTVTGHGADFTWPDEEHTDFVHTSFFLILWRMHLERVAPHVLP